MKKKILSLGIITILIIMLVLLTGCGDTENNKSNENIKINKEYQEYIDAIRNAEASDYFSEYTLGELFDNALTDSVWDQYIRELPGGTNKILISVKGNNKFNENEVTEVIYEVNKETLEYKYYSMYVDNEKVSSLTTLMKDSSNDLDEQKNNQ